MLKIYIFTFISGIYKEANNTMGKKDMRREFTEA